MSKNLTQNLHGCKSLPSGCIGFEGILNSGIHENLMLAVTQGNRSVRRKVLQKMAKILKQKSKPAMTINVVAVDQYNTLTDKTGGAA